MDTLNAQFLSFNQKIRLALSVFAIYWPIRQYVSLDHLDWDIIQKNWLLWLIELVVTVLYFTFWLSVTEWIEQRFVGSFRTGFLVEFKLPAQLLTLLIAGLLAVVFNIGYGALWRRLDWALNHDGTELIGRNGEPPFQNHHNFPGNGPRGDDPHGHGPRGNGPHGHDFRGNDRHRRDKLNNGLVVITLLSAFYLAANRRGYKQLQELRVNGEQLKREAAQAQMLALKNQVNPHFLFNSLNILSSLVEIDQKLSVQFISRLSKAFRYVLEHPDTELVALKTELEFLDSYTFLLNIRFDEKLKVMQTVTDEQANRYSIAPLTLQLLLENVVKHNQMSSEQPLTVLIYVEGEYLIVSNPILLRPTPQRSTGMGLQNIKNRYRLLTDKAVEATEQDGFFVVKIPLLS
ncbi:sensor histidine kinase [Spirosoma foliorum]|uniref:Histidine kinase n=1 Tax=Spirosoma foliorum TaxID=2710596 RepID=A0A7G5H0T0_9BACT|nr:histidine kinase [Spirosoma foliorum]QMW04722.1 histidine kinase [Spirosoma foliorum]